MLDRFDAGFDLVPFVLKLVACVLDSRLEPGLPIRRGFLEFRLQRGQLLAVRGDLSLIVGVLDLDPIAAEYVSAQRLHPGVDGRLPVLIDLRDDRGLSGEQIFRHLLQKVVADARSSEIERCAEHRPGARADRHAEWPTEDPDEASSEQTEDRPLRNLITCSHRQRSARVLGNDRIRIQRDAAVCVQVAKRSQSFVRLFLVVEYHRDYFVHKCLPFLVNYRLCSVASTFACCSLLNVVRSTVPP
jgi:hypothetical protein